MPKGTPKESGINKNPPTNPYNIDNRLCIKIELNENERTYFERLASVMSKVQLGKDKKLLPDKTLSSLGKMALRLLNNVYLTQVLIQSELAKSLPDKQALTEFIAFRRDYMNYPVDKQIADLKRVGIVK